MLAIATEITSSVMSSNVGTTLQVQTTCLLDNSTDIQAASVYKHYNLMISPYFILVTENLWSNPSRAKCTALVGMSYRLNSIYQENAFYVVFKISPTFSGLNKIATRQLQTTISSTTQARFPYFPGKLGLGHQQPLFKWYMYAPWINICENQIFISSKQYGT